MSDCIFIQLLIFFFITICFLTIYRLNLQIGEDLHLCGLRSMMIGLVMFGIYSILEITSLFIELNELFFRFKEYFYFIGVISLGVGMVRWTRFTSDTIVRIRDLAGRDELTGLYNRREFFKRLKKEIEGVRAQGRTFNIMMMDIDDFKQVNDEFGHVMGDLVLEKVAHIISEEIQEPNFIARYGGDEFVAILVSQECDPELITEQIEERIEKSEFLKGKICSISAGWANYPEDEDSKDRLLIKADRMMYERKENKREKS